jgi:hypothetical protein
MAKLGFHVEARDSIEVSALDVALCRIQFLLCESIPYWYLGQRKDGPALALLHRRKGCPRYSSIYLGELVRPVSIHMPGYLLGREVGRGGLSHELGDQGLYID